MPNIYFEGHFDQKLSSGHADGHSRPTAYIATNAVGNNK